MSFPYKTLLASAVFSIALPAVAGAGFTAAGLGGLQQTGLDAPVQAPIIRVMTGGGERGHIARRLQVKLKRRAPRLGIDPNKVWVNRFRALPLDLKSTGRELDAYLIRTYKR